MAGDAFVHGAGMTRFGRNPAPLHALAGEAVARAREEAGAIAERVDQVFVASQAPGELAGQGNLAAVLATALGLPGVPATRVDAASASGAAAVAAACRAVRAGDAETVLVVGVEKMTHVSTPRATAVLSTVLDARERAVGLTMPALAALVARAYLHRYGVTREQLATVPVKAHAHGLRNPFAQFQREVTIEQVLASPVVADPLRIYDCAPLTDGAAALVVSRRSGPVRIAGVGQATDQLALIDRDGGGAGLASFAATRDAAQRAFAASGRAPLEVDVAEVHDAFSILELVNVEDLGFCAPGEAMRLTEQGETSLGGRIPVNPGGGLKARGHPLGASGVAQSCEVFWQLTGRAQARQVDGARVGLTHSVGGFGANNFVTVWEAA